MNPGVASWYALRRVLTSSFDNRQTIKPTRPRESYEYFQSTNKGTLERYKKKRTATPRTYRVHLPPTTYLPPPTSRPLRGNSSIRRTRRYTSHGLRGITRRSYGLRAVQRRLVHDGWTRDWRWGLVHLSPGSLREEAQDYGKKQTQDSIERWKEDILDKDILAGVNPPGNRVSSWRIYKQIRQDTTIYALIPEKQLGEGGEGGIGKEDTEMMKTVHLLDSSNDISDNTYKIQHNTLIYETFRPDTRSYSMEGVVEQCGNDHECRHHKLSPGKFGNYSGRTGRDQESI